MVQTGSSRGPAGISTLFQVESPLLVGIPPHRPPAHAPLSFPHYPDWSGELTPSTPSWETKTQKEGSAVLGPRTHEKQVPRPPASWASGLPTLLWVLSWALMQNATELQMNKGTGDGDVCFPQAVSPAQR